MEEHINGNGFLTPSGQQLVAAAKAELEKVIKELSSGPQKIDMPTIYAILNKLVADTILEQTVTKQKTSSFDTMSDEEFYDYLENKYGFRWFLVSLSPEEFKRLPPSFLKKSDQEEKINHNPLLNPFNPRIYFD
jgi:hypothetical protein